MLPVCSGVASDHGRNSNTSKGLLTYLPSLSAAVAEERLLYEMYNAMVTQAVNIVDIVIIVGIICLKDPVVVEDKDLEEMSTEC